MSRIEKAKSAKTLICLLQSLEGLETTVDLRNELYVKGKIDSVDAYMNIQLSNCVLYNLAGKKREFQSFFVQGKNVRFVHIPDNFDVTRGISQQIEKIKGKRMERAVPRHILARDAKIRKELAKNAQN